MGVNNHNPPKVVYGDFFYGDPFVIGAPREGFEQKTEYRRIPGHIASLATHFHALILRELDSTQDLLNAILSWRRFHDSFLFYKTLLLHNLACKIIRPELWRVAIMAVTVPRVEEEAHTSTMEILPPFYFPDLGGRSPYLWWDDIKTCHMWNLKYFKARHRIDRRPSEQWVPDHELQLPLYLPTILRLIWLNNIIHRYVNCFAWHMLAENSANKGPNTASNETEYIELMLRDTPGLGLWDVRERLYKALRANSSGLPLTNPGKAMDYKSLRDNIERFPPHASEYKQAMEHGTLNLSDAEYVRIASSFYRFELYCALFGPNHGEHPTDSESQKAFLDMHSPWEIEELLCIFRWLCEMNWDPFSKFCNRLVLETVPTQYMHGTFKSTQKSMLFRFENSYEARFYIETITSMGLGFTDNLHHMAVHRPRRIASFFTDTFRGILHGASKLQCEFLNLPARGVLWSKCWYRDFSSVPCMQTAYQPRPTCWSRNSCQVHSYTDSEYGTSDRSSVPVLDEICAATPVDIMDEPPNEASYHALWYYSRFNTQCQGCLVTRIMTTPTHWCFWDEERLRTLPIPWEGGHEDCDKLWRGWNHSKAPEAWSGRGMGYWVGSQNLMVAEFMRHNFGVGEQRGEEGAFHYVRLVVKMAMHVWPREFTQSWEYLSWDFTSCHHPFEDDDVESQSSICGEQEDNREEKKKDQPNIGSTGERSRVQGDTREDTA